MTALALLATVFAIQTEIGRPLPDVTLNNMQGQPVNLQQFLGKKVIVFNWASW